MAHWYSKDLGDGFDAFTPTRQIQKTFTTAFEKSGRPNDMAVFSRYDMKTNTFTVYFSPHAAEVAMEFAAAPCDKPENGDSLTLLAGHLTSQEVLFTQQ